MRWTVYISQNNALIALKFRILKAKLCCESSPGRLQWKQMIFYASDTFLIWFWHFGVLLYSMRLSKKGIVSKLGLLLSPHTFSLSPRSSFTWSCCVPPETFPGVSHRVQSQEPTPISPRRCRAEGGLLASLPKLPSNFFPAARLQ